MLVNAEEGRKLLIVPRRAPGPLSWTRYRTEDAHVV